MMVLSWSFGQWRCARQVCGTRWDPDNAKPYRTSTCSTCFLFLFISFQISRNFVSYKRANRWSHFGIFNSYPSMIISSRDGVHLFWFVSSIIVVWNSNKSRRIYLTWLITNLKVGKYVETKYCIINYRQN